MHKCKNCGESIWMSLGKWYHSRWGNIKCETKIVQTKAEPK